MTVKNNNNNNFNELEKVDNFVAKFKNNSLHIMMKSQNCVTQKQ